ncbi:hypothetical protein [Sphingomonas melonis]|uniref:Uncharacterized protein n=1 Tax=Sphingomonas melonis TaxID=152682 RepID=A0A7Y9FQ68_9SPHN|nr:hypothetical protein [Sphingomonas melonis]NYD91409.1 hypothetical protein [Sphingomonas melonis]
MSRWFILRTSGGQTLPLMRSLRAAGYDVWTPAKVLRRTVRAKTPAGTRTIEADAPILPTFLFAKEEHLVALTGEASDPASQHPAFSVFHRAGKAPIIGGAQITGLQAEEAREQAAIAAIRDAETYQEAQRIRMATAKTEAARRRAARAVELAQLRELRGKPMAFAAGAEVTVTNMPAMDGLTGVVEAVNGPAARVQFGNRSWKIEGWRLLPASQQTKAA